MAINWDEIRKKAQAKGMQAESQVNFTRATPSLPRADTLPKYTVTPITPSTFRNASALTKITPTPKTQMVNVTLPMGKTIQVESNIPKKNVLEEAFDPSENYIDKFKQGNIGGGVANFLGTGLTAAQTLYLNAANSADSLTRGEGLPKFKPQMGFTSYDKAIAERRGEIPTIKKASNINPLLGKAYGFVGEVGTDPLELTPAGYLNDIKLAKGFNQNSQAYLQALQKGNLTPTIQAATQGVSKNVSAPLPRVLPRVSAEKPIDPIPKSMLQTPKTKPLNRPMDITPFTQDDTLSYRFSRGENPMSDYGHAMFADKAERVSMFGNIANTVKKSDLTDINELKPEIRKQWIKDKREGILDDYGLSVNKKDKTKDIIELFDPDDIADSAGAYDSGEANQWLFDRVLDPMGIYGVKTNDGAVVFDPSLISKDEKATKYFQNVFEKQPYIAKGKTKQLRLLPRATESTVQPILPRKGAEIPTAIKTPEISQKPIGKVEQKFKDLGADTNRFEEVAMVTTDSKQTQPSLLEKAVGLTREAKRKFLDSGETVARIGKINNDKGLYNLYNNAKNAGRRAEYHIGEAQTDINGNEIGKSLKAIFDPIRKKGTNYYEDFQEYMYHLHNIDRMAQEKPVFGESITAEESKKVSDYLLSQHPEFAQEAAEVRNYLDNMMQYRVQGGLVSEEGAKALNEMYSNYVPTYRLNPSTKGLTYSGQVTDIKTGIKKAVGSSKDLLPLHEQISKQTMQAVKATHDNLFGLRLAQNINPKTQQYVQELKKIQDTIDIDAEDVPELKNAFKIFENGQAYQMKVESGLYEGIQELAGKSPNDLIKAANATNKGFKQLITSWSPMFVIRNPIRDVQDVLLYSKDLGAFIKAYPSAIKELATNGEVWKKYKALGGAGNSFFDYAKGYKDNPSWLRKNTLDRVEQLNMALEQLPRLTEFMATINKLGHEPNYDELMQAMYNAADITVNFGSSGTWGKTLNSTFVPFFNPAIQGTDKIVRRFTETKGVKDWTELVLKISAFGIAPSVLNEMLYLNDPEYQRINDREKDINFLFKIGDGEFVKIPKGRVLSLFGSAAQRGLRAASGQKDAYAGYIKVMGGQVAPISPTDSNILSPIAAVKANKSWYGGTIEPQSLTTKYPSDKYQFKRFDERTSGIAKTIGKALNYSPKKVDYLIDAYSGVVGDFAIPLSTPKAEQNPFIKAFTVDSVTSNKIGQQFYDKKDDILSAKNSTDGEDKNDVLNRYMNKQSETVSDLYDQIRKIENGIGTDKVKREKVREIRALINGVQQTALDTLPEIEKTTKQLSTRISDPDELYRETNKKVFGSKYALQVYDKDVYEKAVRSGINMDSFYDSYFAQKDQPTNLGKAMALIDNGQNTFAVFDISDATVEAAQMLKQNNISAEEYESIKQSANINGNANVSKAEAEDYLNNSNYSQSQRAAMLKALVPNLKDKNNPYY